MIASIRRKARESAELAVAFADEHAEEIERCVVAMAERFRKGGQLLVAGNGGSACDAQHVTVEFLHPIIEKRRRLAARALVADTALLSAIGNDVDFGEVFAEQIRVLGRPEDMLLGISTSGASTNVIRGVRQAREQGLLTLGFAGRDGGALADLCDHCFVVPSWSIHRIQECHTLMLHLLWDQLHVALGEDDVL